MCVFACVHECVCACVYVCMCEHTCVGMCYESGKLLSEFCICLNQSRYLHDYADKSRSMWWQVANT